MISASLLSCNEAPSTFNSDTFNYKIIYLTQPCNNDFSIYTKNIKKEHHQIDNFLTGDKSDCSVDYELDGKPLKYRSPSMNYEEVYNYSTDGLYYEILDSNNKQLGKFVVTQNNNGQVIKKSLNTMEVDYGYNQHNQLDYMKVYVDPELVMTYSYQWNNDNIASSCITLNKLISYIEYVNHDIFNYVTSNNLASNDLSCEQVKQKYISKDYDKFNPITLYSSQCQQTDAHGNCIYSKLFTNGELFSEKHSSYEYY